MVKKYLDKIADLYQLINLIIAGILAIYALIFGVIKGISSHTISDTVGWVAIGIVGGFLIIGSYAALNPGLIVWDKSTSWLSRPIRKHPYLRLIFVFPSILLSFYAAYLVLGNSRTDLFTKIFFCV